MTDFSIIGTEGPETVLIPNTSRVRRMRQALEAARHDLTTVHGLIATDRPDLWDRQLAWEIDVKQTLGLIDAALLMVPEPDTRLDQLLSELADIKRSLRLLCK